MSSKYVGIEEGRKRLGDLVTAVQQGADVVLTRNGRPAARIVRYQEDPMFMPVSEEITAVTDLRPGDKIIDDGDELFVTGEPTRRDGEVVVPLATEHGGDATPYGFEPDHRVTRVLIDAPVVQRAPGHWQ